MKRPLVSILVPLVSTPLALIGSGTTADAGIAGKCTDPAAKRTYTRSQFGYRLDLDLSGCAWWDGSPFRLAANLDRFDVAEGHNASTFVLCSALPTAPEEEAADDAPMVEPAGRPSGVCGVEVTLDHPPTEAARYRGEISYPWWDGRRRVGFVALCGPAGGCVDMPVEPTDFLGPAPDPNDIVAGDASAG